MEQPVAQSWRRSVAIFPSTALNPFCAAPAELPFLPPLHSREHRNRIGNFNIANQPKVFAENLCRSRFAQWIRRRIGLGSIKKDAHKLPARSQQLRDTFGILRPSPRVKRAQKSPLINQIKPAWEIEFEKFPWIILPSKFFSAFLIWVTATAEKSIAVASKPAL
jgi:hypothetical protein